MSHPGGDGRDFGEHAVPLFPFHLHGSDLVRGSSSFTQLSGVVVAPRPNHHEADRFVLSERKGCPASGCNRVAVGNLRLHRVVSPGLCAITQRPFPIDPPSPDRPILAQCYGMLLAGGNRHDARQILAGLGLHLPGKAVAFIPLVQVAPAKDPHRSIVRQRHGMADTGRDGGDALQMPIPGLSSHLDWPVPLIGRPVA